MSLLFIDSFDHYGSADLGLKWSSIVPGGDAGVTIASTSGRRGGGALRISTDGSARKFLAGSYTVIVGAAMKFSTVGSNVPAQRYFISFSGVAGSHIWVGTNSDGSIGVWRQGGSSANDNVNIATTTGGILQPNVYAYIEVKVKLDATLGQVKVLVNGVQVLNLPNIDTLGYYSTPEPVTKVALFATWNNSADAALFDDLYICDDAGTVNNDFFGDVRIDVVTPNADGTYSAFTPDTGTVHYSRVNELVADQLSNVASATVGAKDSYQFTDLTSVVGAIRGVQIVDAALKDDAGTRSIAHLVKSGATEVQSAAMPLSTDRKLYTTIHETDPATSAAWTQSGINAAEFGIVVAA